ncbi:hypothetical protein PFZ49_05910, partial [Microbacterium lacticum]
ATTPEAAPAVTAGVAPDPAPAATLGRTLVPALLVALAAPALFALLVPWLGWLLLAAGVGTAAIVERGRVRASAPSLTRDLSLIAAVSGVSPSRARARGRRGRTGGSWHPGGRPA